VETVAIDLEESRSLLKRRVRLSTDGKPLSFTPEQVEVTVTLTEEEISRSFSAIEVEAKDFTGEYTASPPAVDLQLFGPRSIIEKLELSKDQVYLDLKGLPTGQHSVPLRIDLPPEIKVTEQKPRRFKVHIKKVGA
jgi:YbbR domain-containing protein